MKKLIVAAAIACAAAVTQASTVNWGLSGNLDETKFASGTAYLICVNDLAKPTFSDDAGAATWFSDNKGSLATKAFRSGTINSGAVTESEVIESPTGRKNYYLVLVDSTDSYIAVSTTTKAINIQAGTMNVSATWLASTQMTSFATSSVPEPTSGLLLLLGVAGLALKRTRA